jgi:RNA polymerase sigma-70 factor, ECF subfamily
MTTATTNTSPDTVRQERFLRMLEPVHDELVKYTRAMTFDRDDMLDVLGETLLAAYEQSDGIVKPESFRYFLFTVARRAYARMKWRRRFFVRLTSREIEQCWSGEPAPDAAADVDILYRTLQRLPARYRDTLLLFELAGFSLEEIRVIQGGSLSGVKSRLARGRKKLAALLSDNQSVFMPVETFATG